MPSTLSPYAYKSYRKMYTCRSHRIIWFSLKYTFTNLCMEKAMAPHSSTLAWKMPWTEEPGRLQSTGSLRVRHDWATSFTFSLWCIGGGNGNPLQCPCLKNPRDDGAWWAAVYGVAQSRTRLKRLSSSSSSCGRDNWLWNSTLLISSYFMSKRF